MSYVHFRESAPLARKRHRCIWCGESILRGSGYIRVISVFDGEFQNHAFHPECRTAINARDHDDGPEFEAYSNERPAMP